jgi:hypothetical protein
MSARLVVGVGVAACVVSAIVWNAAAGAAGGRDPAKSAAAAAKPAGIASFAGAWRLDPARSTRPQRPGGPREGIGRGPGGPAGPRGPGQPGDGVRAVPDGGPRRPDAGNFPRGPGRQRSFLRIDVGGGLMSVADSAGTVMYEIAYEDDAPPAGETRRLGGEWTGRNLVAIGETPMGGLVTETYTLGDQGATLEIRSKVEAQGDRPEIQFVRVYRRAGTK